MLVATASLFLVIGAIDAARAEDDRVTLYTALLRGDTFNCNAVNISRKTIHIAFAVLDASLLRSSYGSASGNHRDRNRGEAEATARAGKR
jgi:hypothetical protein